NAIVPRLIVEKIIEPAGDDNVEVEIEHLSRKALQLLLPQRDFPPWKPAPVFGQLDIWQRIDLDLAVDPLRLIRVANEPREPGGVTPNHGVKPVDIIRPIARSPFHANHGLRHCPSLCPDSPYSRPRL